MIPSVATLWTNKNSEALPIKGALDGVGTAKTIAIAREMARGSKDLPAQTFRAPDFRSTSERAIRFSDTECPAWRIRFWNAATLCLECVEPDWELTSMKIITTVLTAFILLALTQVASPQDGRFELAGCTTQSYQKVPKTSSAISGLSYIIPILFMATRQESTWWHGIVQCKYFEEEPPPTQP